MSKSGIDSFRVQEAPNSKSNRSGSRIVMSAVYQATSEPAPDPGPAPPECPVPCMLNEVRTAIRKYPEAHPLDPRGELEIPDAAKYFALRGRACGKLLRRTFPAPPSPVFSTPRFGPAFIADTEGQESGAGDRPQPNSARRSSDVFSSASGKSANKRRHFGLGFLRLLPRADPLCGLPWPRYWPLAMQHQARSCGRRNLTAP